MQKNNITTTYRDFISFHNAAALTEANKKTALHALQPVDTVGILAGYYDERLTISYASGLFLQILGYGFSDFCGNEQPSLMALVHEYSTAGFRQKFDRVNKLDALYLCMKDGTPIVVSGQKDEIVDAQGVLMWMLAIRTDRDTKSSRQIYGISHAGLWCAECDELKNITSVTLGVQECVSLGCISGEDVLDVPDLWIKFVHPEDRSRVLFDMNAAMRDVSNRTKYDVEYRLLTKEDGYRWFHSVGEIVRSIDGSPRRMIGVSVDINECKRARADAARYHTFRIANVGEICVDLQNNTCKSLREHPGIFDQMIPENDWDAGIDAFAKRYVQPSEQDEVCNFLSRETIQAQLCSGNRAELTMHIHAVIDGAQRCLRAAIMPGKREKNGTLRIAVIILRDITEQENAHQSQRARSENSALDTLLQSMIQNINRFGVVDLRRDTYEMYGMGSDSWYAPNGIYHEWVEKFARGFKTASADQTICQACDPETIRNMICTPQDIYKFVYSTKDENIFKTMSILPLEWDKEELVRVVFLTKDVTQERLADIRSQQVLRAAFEAANNANEAKTNFLNSMSHDIRTPMNGIVGMTAIAEANIDNKERVRDCLKKINSASKHLVALINEVLDMSRIESGRIALEDGAFNLPDLIDNVLSMVKSQLAEREHELNVRVHDIKHENVIGDSLRVQQVFVNLLSNAIKYTPKNGHIEVMISELETNKPNIGCYEFIFKDNGIGMSKEFLPKFFDPFEREDNSFTTKAQGTGLGMAIARNIVHMMDGDIHVESELGEGTTITVTIFLKLQEMQFEDISNLAGLSVLITDDDAVSCENTAKILQDIGMDCEWVTSGAQAIERVHARHEEHNDYFAVIVDWRMPGIDGVRTARAIRNIVGNDVPIVVISAYDWTDIETEAREAGVTDFISKPIFRSRLETLFRRMGSEVLNMREDLDAMDSFAEANYTGKRFLLAEDNELNREIAKEILLMTGAEVEEAENGKIAVDMISKHPIKYYDMVFMDIRMPVMDGYQAAAAIRSLGGWYAERLPIVAMTANAFAEDVVEAQNAGMNEHISKPIDLRHLRQIMRKWLK